MPLIINVYYRHYLAITVSHMPPPCRPLFSHHAHSSLLFATCFRHIIIHYPSLRYPLRHLRSFTYILSSFIDTAAIFLLSPFRYYYCYFAYRRYSLRCHYFHYYARHYFTWRFRHVYADVAMPHYYSRYHAAILHAICTFYARRHFFFHCHIIATPLLMPLNQLLNRHPLFHYHIFIFVIAFVGCRHCHITPLLLSLSHLHSVFIRHYH